MVRKEKCSACRDAKQKCLPEERRWDETFQQRCEKCIKGHRVCGPNENPPRRPPRQRIRPRDQDRGSESDRETHASEPAEEITRSSQGSCKTPQTLASDYTQELRDRLKDLDTEAETARLIQVTFETLGNRGLQSNMLSMGSDFYNLNNLKYDTSQRLLSRLNVVEILGDRVDAAGFTDLAEIAYNRVLDIYRAQSIPVGSFIRRLLVKMASFYWRTDRHIRAEKCWWEIFELRDPPSQAQSTTKGEWQNLVTSLSKTSGMISECLRSKYPHVFTESPFPTTHRMIISDITSSDTPMQPGNIHSALIGGSGKVEELSHRISDSELATRGLLSMTPLFSATFFKQEDAGHALLAKIATQPLALRRQHINARDISGHTILETAILSGFSLEFLQALINHGAEINPTLMKDTLTPLQAACVVNNLSIVGLLLEHGADIHHAHHFSLTPIQLAEAAGNEKILRLIDEKSSFLSNVFLTNQDSLDEDGVDSTDDSNAR